jgi:hypothetical protein
MFKRGDDIADRRLTDAELLSGTGHCPRYHQGPKAI